MHGYMSRGARLHHFVLQIGSGHQATSVYFRSFSEWWKLDWYRPILAMVTTGNYERDLKNIT